MSHKQDTLLRSILEDGAGGNIHWREVESLLNYLGAQLEPAHGARFKVTLNEVTDFLHHPIQFDRIVARTGRSQHDAADQARIFDGGHAGDETTRRMADQDGWPAVFAANDRSDIAGQVL